MIEADMLGDLDGRDLIWLTVLGSVLCEPMALGVLVMRLEALVLGELDETPLSISRCLHEMNRGGHIVLANTGKRWRVSLGPRGRDTFLRLMGAREISHASSLAAIGHRIRAAFAGLASFSVA
jgi:hypothetical protein